HDTKEIGERFRMGDTQTRGNSSDSEILLARLEEADPVQSIGQSSCHSKSHFAASNLIFVGDPFGKTKTLVRRTGLLLNIWNLRNLPGDPVQVGRHRLKWLPQVIVLRHTQSPKKLDPVANQRSRKRFRERSRARHSIFGYAPRVIASFPSRSTITGYSLM